MGYIVRTLSIVAIVALCLTTVAFAQGQQQARPAGQAAPAAQAAKDTCWGKTPCPEAGRREFSHQRPLRWSGRRLEHIGNFAQRRPLENTQDPGARQNI